MWTPKETGNSVCEIRLPRVTCVLNCALHYCTASPVLRGHDEGLSVSKGAFMLLCLSLIVHSGIKLALRAGGLCYWPVMTQHGLIDWRVSWILRLEVKDPVPFIYTRPLTMQESEHRNMDLSVSGWSPTTSYELQLGENVLLNRLRMPANDWSWDF